MSPPSLAATHRPPFSRRVACGGAALPVPTVQRTCTCEPPSRRSPTCQEASGYCLLLLPPFDVRLVLPRAHLLPRACLQIVRSCRAALARLLRAPLASMRALPRRPAGVWEAAGQTTQCGRATQHAAHARSLLCCSSACQSSAALASARTQGWPPYFRRACRAIITQQVRKLRCYFPR